MLTDANENVSRETSALAWNKPNGKKNMDQGLIREDEVDMCIATNASVGLTTATDGMCILSRNLSRDIYSKCLQMECCTIELNLTVS